MKFFNSSISLVTSPENTTPDENKIRWIIEVNDLCKQNKGDNRYESVFNSS